MGLKGKKFGVYSVQSCVTDEAWLGNKLLGNLNNEEYPDTQTSINNLALTYWSQRCFMEAEETQIEIIAIFWAGAAA